jgi:outer membrane receptor protein involved in Fe transport
MVCFCTFCTNDTISSDTLSIEIKEEVVVSAFSNMQISGLRTGKIVLNPEALSCLPSIQGTTDLLKLLELTPSVQNPGDASSNLYVRGGDIGQNLLLYAGAPLYTSGHLFGFFPMFNAEHTASLEMTVSDIHARYGGRLSSAIEMRTKTYIPEKTSIRGNIGLLASQATLAVPLGKNFGLYLSGRQTYINLIVQPLITKIINKGETDKMNAPDYYFGDANLTLTGNLSENDRITFDAFLSNDYLNMVDESLLLDGTLKWKNALFSALWNHRQGDNTLIQQIYTSHYRNDLDTRQTEMQMLLESGICDYGYKNRVFFNIGDILLETGLQYAFHSVQPHNWTISNAGYIYNQNPLSKQTAHDAAAYVSASLNLLPQLDASSGVRYSIFYNNTLFADIEPRVALSYHVSENSMLTASYCRQNQYLNLLSPTSIGLPLDFWVSASTEMPPQSGNNFSVTYYKSMFNNNLELSSSLFFRTMNNLNEYVQTITTGEIQTFSGELYVGRGKAYGLEIMLKKNTGKFTGWLSYALGRSERQFPQINEGRIFPARFDRRHNLSVVASYTKNEKWSFSAVFAYSTGNAYTLPSSWYFIGNMPVKEYAAYNGARMPAYNRMDISANYSFNRDNGLSFSIYNVFAINNPVYIFMNVEHKKETGQLFIKTRHKQLSTITPSLSWRFKF